MVPSEGDSRSCEGCMTSSTLPPPVIAPKLFDVSFKSLTFSSISFCFVFYITITSVLLKSACGMWNMRYNNPKCSPPITLPPPHPTATPTT